MRLDLSASSLSYHCFHRLWLMASIFHTRKLDITEYMHDIGVPMLHKKVDVEFPHVQTVCTTLSWGPEYKASVLYGTESGYYICSHFQFLSLPYVPTHPNLMKLEPAKMAHIAHLAILQLLFLSSVASTAPRWESSFLRHSTPPAACGKRTKPQKSCYTKIRAIPDLQSLIMHWV